MRFQPINEPINESMNEGVNEPRMHECMHEAAGLRGNEKGRRNEISTKSFLLNED
jgi:hypothetical protein